MTLLRSLKTKKVEKNHLKYFLSGTLYEYYGNNLKAREKYNNFGKKIIYGYKIDMASCALCMRKLLKFEANSIVFTLNATCDRFDLFGIRFNWFPK